MIDDKVAPKNDSSTAASPPQPIPNCYRVPDSRIIAGEYPGDWDPTKAVERISAFLDAGVEGFIDLTEEGELDSYEPLLRDEAEIRGMSVAYIRLPIRDFRVPTIDEMSRLQWVLADAERLGKTVYIHCRGGVGRTGTVVGCYLVERGYSSDGALDLVQRLFHEMSPEKLRNHPDGSPETEAQREFVRQWARKRPRTADFSGDSMFQPVMDREEPGIDRPRADG
jgi:protein-tyrosine phosphatase